MVGCHYGVDRVGSALDEAHLDVLGLRYRDPEREALAVDDGGYAPRAAPWIRLLVPIRSSGPVQPQSETRSAISVNESGIDVGTGLL